MLRFMNTNTLKPSIHDYVPKPGIVNKLGFEILYKQVCPETFGISAKTGFRCMIDKNTCENMGKSLPYQPCFYKNVIMKFR